MTRAIMLKRLEQVNNRSLSIDVFNQIIELKNGINTLRTNYNDYTVSSVYF